MRVWLAALSILVLGCGGPGERSTPSPPGSLPRIVSVNPSLTAILLALDAADALVGVDEFSAAQHPETAHLPRVGGLFNPSLEAVAALAADAVIVVPSVEQRDFVNRLEEMGVRVLVLENIELAQVLENIAELGALVGRDAQAAERIEAIERAVAAAVHVTRARPRPRVLVVLQRDPVFVVGRRGFIDELLTAAGGENLGSTFGDAYPQVALEWLIEAAPEVLIDMTTEPIEPIEYWSRWPTIPAVAGERVLHLDPKTVTLPGPYLDRSLLSLVEALHGAAVRDELLLVSARRAGSGG
jgi:iron complex transport system substrate-binding protein